MPQPRFIFRLEALLTQRRQQEKDKQQAVGRIMGEIQAQVAILQAAQARIVAENGSLTARELTGILDMHYIAHEKRYVGNLQVKIVLGMKKLAAMEQALGVARRELLEAARARKVIEKLREKQRERWQAEINRKEAAAMDEIGAQLAMRRLLENEIATDGAIA